MFEIELFWHLTVYKQKNGNYTRMLRAILNKSWRQHSTYLPSRKLSKLDEPDMRHCWRIRDALISDVLLWTPSDGRAKVGRPARTYIQKLCEDSGCSPDDLPEAMNDKEEWRERVRDIRAGGKRWWWWWFV